MRFVISLLFLVLIQPARACTLDVYQNMVSIIGEIEEGDSAAFALILDQHPDVNYVALFSPGGDYLEALRIGATIRTRGLTTTAPSSKFCDRPTWDGPPCRCDSACFFVWAAGTPRLGDKLRVHEPKIDDADSAAMSPGERQRATQALINHAADYMTKVGVPPLIQIKVLTTPFDAPAALSLSEIAEMQRVPNE